MKMLFGMASIHHLAGIEAKLALMSAAMDSGFSGFDVSPMYGNGIAEDAIGRYLRQNKGIRHRIELNTKWGIPFRGYPYAAHFLFPAFRLVDIGAKRFSPLPMRDYSIGALTYSVEQSLRRLGVDYIDTLFVHEPLYFVEHAIGDSVKEALSRLVKDGKIRTFGVSGGVVSAVNSWSQVVDGAVVQCSAVQANDIYRSSSASVRYCYGLSAMQPPARITASTYAASARRVGATGFLYSTRSLLHLKEFFLEGL